MWDNFEKRNCSTSKTVRFALKTHFLEILLVYPVKSHNSSNFREGRQHATLRHCQQSLGTVKSPLKSTLNSVTVIGRTLWVYSGSSSGKFRTDE